MARRIILWDYENIGDSILEELDLIRKQDVTYLFKPIKMNKDSLSRIERRFREEKLTLKIVPIYNYGKNALDFQLASLMGNLIKTSPKSSYFILAEDLGYLPLRYFWGSQNVKVICSNSIKKSINSESIIENFTKIHNISIADFISKVSYNYNMLNNLREVDFSSNLAKNWLAEEIYMYKDSDVFMQYFLQDLITDDYNITYLTFNHIKVIVKNWFKFVHCTSTEEQNENT